jgi:hypothetical protein
MYRLQSRVQSGYATPAVIGAPSIPSGQRQNDARCWGVIALGIGGINEPVPTGGNRKTQILFNLAAKGGTWQAQTRGNRV